MAVATSASDIPGATKAAELFPLDLPGILQLAYQSTLDGRVREYVQHSGPLAARLRVSADAGGWPARHPGDFAPLVSLLPTVVPEVIDNAFTFLQHFPEGEAAEEVVFVRAVRMAQTLASLRSADPPEKIGEILSGIGKEGTERAKKTSGTGETLSYAELKNRLYASPDNPVHGFLRSLFHEVPYESHPYVALLRKLQ